ncbi:hypothetical protein [Actinomycetospora flava]|uniref:Uncharacterized protein n=1 Tax=Actinomycetospora flava TaxID=3129232 RepID=A0ABU8MBE3_9PSEU
MIEWQTGVETAVDGGVVSVADGSRPANLGPGPSTGPWSALDAPTMIGRRAASTTHNPHPRPEVSRTDLDAATHAPSFGHLFTSTNVRRSSTSGPERPKAPRRHPTLIALPLAALAGLVVIGVSIFLSWHTDGGGLAGSAVGIGALGVTAALGLAAVADLVTGRIEATGLVVLPSLLVLAILAVAATAAAASDTGVLAQLGLPPGVHGLGPDVLLLGLAVTAVVGVLATYGFVQGWGSVDSARPIRSRRRGVVVVSAALGVLVLLGASAAVLATASAAPPPRAPTAIGDPAAFVGGNGVLSGPLSSSSAVVPSYGGPMPTTACPPTAQSTLPEPAGAVLIGRSTSVAIALCQGASGRLYYFGANPTTQMTLTLPARRTASTWTASDNGLTYVITETHVGVQRDGVLVADEPLTGGW